MKDDLPLICAHLLGGTSGLQLAQIETDQQIQELVAKAVKVAVEIQRQVAAIQPSGQNTFTETASAIKGER